MSAWEKNMEKEIAELKKGLNLRIDTQHDSDMRSLDIIGINELDIRHIKSVLKKFLEYFKEEYMMGNAEALDEFFEEKSYIDGLIKELSAKEVEKQ